MDKQTTKIMFSSGRDFLETPQDFFDKLNREYNFTLDPASTAGNAKCKTFFTEKENGLIQSWENHRVFLNPPYSQSLLWLKKAYMEYMEHECHIFVLIPSRTDTAYWHNYCMKSTNIHFIKGRLFFEIGGKNILDKHGKPTPAPFPSALIEFDSRNRLTSSAPSIYTIKNK